jgi:hypothetical protein
MPSMVAMSMCDERTIHRLPRVDEEIARFAIQTVFRDFKKHTYLVLQS